MAAAQSGLHLSMRSDGSQEMRSRACLYGEGWMCYTARRRQFYEGGLMARGREKDRKVRKKHLKNVKRVKALAKSRRTAAARSKRK